MINIRDPIHGFISLDDLEAKVMQTYEFQRLKFISQLGTTSWVYPGSTHSRFEHSLGVFYLAKMVLFLSPLPKELLPKIQEIKTEILGVLFIGKYHGKRKTNRK